MSVSTSAVAANKPALSEVEWAVPRRWVPVALTSDTAHAVVEALGLEQKNVLVEGLALRWQRGTLVMQSAERSPVPCLVEQQWKLSTICDSTHGALFVCHYIAQMERMERAGKPQRGWANREVEWS